MPTEIGPCTLSPRVRLAALFLMVSVASDGPVIEFFELPRMSMRLTPPIVASPVIITSLIGEPQYSFCAVVVSAPVPSGPSPSITNVLPLVISARARLLPLVVSMWLKSNWPPLFTVIVPPLDPAAPTTALSPSLTTPARISMSGVPARALASIVRLPLPSLTRRLEVIAPAPSKT